MFIPSIVMFEVLAFPKAMQGDNLSSLFIIVVTE